MIRIGGRTYFASDIHTGRPDEVHLRPGEHIDLGFGAYRKTKPVRQRVVVCWKKHYEEAWFLATDLEWGWRQVVSAYGLRMQLEQLFRDEKNIRFGWGLRQTDVSTVERLERRLLILAFAYLFLILVGLLGTETLSPSYWASGSSRAKRQDSLFTIGRHVQDQIRCGIRPLLRLLRSTLRELARDNWG